MGVELHGRRDARGRLMVHVDGLAARLECRHHHAEASHASIHRAAEGAVELGLAALSCRPEHVPIAAAALTRARATRASANEETRPELTTVLEFHSARGPLPPADAMVAKARRLREQGATDLTLILTKMRLSPQMCPAEDKLAALCEDQALRGGRVCVHLDTTGLAEEQVAEAAARSERAGAWMIQTGSGHGERAGFQTTQIVRRAVSSHVLVKWGYPLMWFPPNRGGLLYAASWSGAAVFS